ncbi:MAG: hypothetical protein CVU50_09365 [Candidatus Cloacimonetes bacterium HGW-Cloacimonetes-3]|jgi:hypothetical protein|nr:MAG: hypothetical protein CVU50_09365 [Candidatus Cloacimonetes bacterium HGW-Cloacimonetes-3]
MAKSVVSSLKYNGDGKELITVINETCMRMGLTIKSGVNINKGYIIEASERLRILSTNWPISFKIEIEVMGKDIWAVIITASCFLTSITQETNMQNKANEIVQLIKTLGSGTIT